jgi:DNA uptake protein ComE-like DNA-binding protein
VDYILAIKFKLVLSLLFTLTISESGYSQTEDPDLFERTTERVSGITDKPVDFSEVSEVTEQLKDRPINLNKTSEEELHQISFLDDHKISNLIRYIMTYGTIYSIYELKVVDGFDSTTIRQILPYVYAGPEKEKHPIRLNDLLTSGKNQLIIRAGQIMQQQAGYHVSDSVLQKNPNTGYEGSPLKLYFRYSYSFFDRFSIGLSGDKDAGEKFFSGSQKYEMDFYSGYISLLNTGIFKLITLGNFNVDFGQGLTLCSGLSSGAISGTGNMRRYASGIKLSQSTNEGNYLRGVAIVLKKWKFRLSLFYSNHKRDGNVTGTDTITGHAELISSMSSTGYHRTPREIENKNTIRESIIGGNINFKNSYFSVGFTGFRSHWSAELEAKKYPYNLFYFQGNKNLNFGLDFQAELKDVFLFGEISRSRNGGLAFISGICFTPDPRLSFSLSVRDYQRNYQDLLSNAFGQNSLNANEEGIQFTFNASLAPGFGLKGYIDVFRFPWLKYRTDSPSLGSDYQVQLDYSSIRSVKMFIRFRDRSKQMNLKETTLPLNVLGKWNSTTLLYEADWQISASLSFKTRCEWLRNHNEHQNPAFGCLLGQDLSYKCVKQHITLSLLYTLFDADSYNERIYSYENDVLYSYSIPAFYGKGIHSMILLEWAPSNWVDLSIKYGQTWYSDRSVIGTGLDQIKGNIKSEVEVQYKVKF